MRDDLSRTVYTVSEFTKHLKQTLEETFSTVWVQGEVSGLSRPSSGHCYFNLNDESAQLRAVLWRTTSQRMNFQLEDGQKVLCCGDIDIYPPRGTYQLVVRYLEPVGEGSLQVAFRQLYQKLAAEGLFDARLKRQLPKFPRRIGLITSPSGAAVRDFCQIAKRRWPLTDILIFGCRVQGNEAPAEIVQAIQNAARISPRIDALVITRGGGSAEDLWSFNDERVVRAIRASSIPTLSAIGHEIDVTLSDLAADAKALTPSEAAEKVFPDRMEWYNFLADASARLSFLVSQQINTARSRLAALAAQRCLRRPEDLLTERYQRIDLIEQRLQTAMDRFIERARHRWQQSSSRLAAVNPLAVLARGYSLTTDLEGKLLSSSDRVNPGDEIKTTLDWGQLVSHVKRVTT
ncbi:MAG TPA: exodeoxyribonuclease VII large subunit [Pirellulaceae bacterium]|nr:exodeoxyribonuclease VII large subunit [Pirellulaceae bacterium]